MYGGGGGAGGGGGYELIGSEVILTGGDRTRFGEEETWSSEGRRAVRTGGDVSGEENPRAEGAEKTESLKGVLGVIVSSRKRTARSDGIVGARVYSDSDTLVVVDIVSELLEVVRPGEMALLLSSSKSSSLLAP